MPRAFAGKESILSIMLGHVHIARKIMSLDAYMILSERYSTCSRRPYMLDRRRRDGERSLWKLCRAESATSILPDASIDEMT